MGPTAVSSASITPSRRHSSLTAASPAFAVSVRSGAPVRTRWASVYSGLYLAVPCQGRDGQAGRWSGRELGEPCADQWQGREGGADMIDLAHVFDLGAAAHVLDFAQACLGVGEDRVVVAV